MQKARFDQRFIGLWLLLILPFAGLGCGYTNQTVLPVDMQTIYVDTVKNAIPINRMYSFEPGLEMMITNAIIRRFERDGNMRIVKKEEADAILESKLIGYEQEGVRFSKLEQVQEYRLFIVLDVSLINRKTGDVIWREPNFSGDTEFFVGDFRSQDRNKATPDAVERLARNVVDRVVEDW
ncbi:MAG: LptE family protein [Candidatus Omnitrophica bacterium]|nr:LptE family protein [Candidatus Omnitrophota bacterium]MDD5671968.1 LptE family protein [Candidatus Omnitrophota bacterium]